MSNINVNRKHQIIERIVAERLIIIVLIVPTHLLASYNKLHDTY